MIYYKNLTFINIEVFNLIQNISRFRIYHFSYNPLLDNVESKMINIIVTVLCVYVRCVCMVLYDIIEIIDIY